jgi:hypothetical protein
VRIVIVCPSWSTGDRSVYESVLSRESRREFCRSFNVGITATHKNSLGFCFYRGVFGQAITDPLVPYLTNILLSHVIFCDSNFPNPSLSSVHHKVWLRLSFCSNAMALDPFVWKLIIRDRMGRQDRSNGSSRRSARRSRANGTPLTELLGAGRRKCYLINQECRSMKPRKRARIHWSKIGALIVREVDSIPFG